MTDLFKQSYFSPQLANLSLRLLNRPILNRTGGNFLKVAGYANTELEDEEEPEDDKTPEFDWIMRFFDTVSLISDEDLQKLWGQILAGEIKHPGICSLRTIDIIRNLSRKEAEDLNELSRYVMFSGNSAFIFENGFRSFEQFDIENSLPNKESSEYIKNKNLNYIANIQPLVEAGIFTANHYFYGDFEDNNTVHMENSKLLCIISCDDNKEVIKFEPYFLTKSGVEIFKIIQQTKTFEADYEYQICCIKELKKAYEKAKFSVYMIHNLNDFEEIEI